MKQVVSPDMVAHLWANQNQESARTGNGTLYFNNETIYSYGSHFPIAKHVTNEDGLKAVLFTTSSYSVTTSAHMSIVRSAASHKDLILVPNPDNDKFLNFGDWISQIKSIAKSLETARKPEKYLNQITGIYYNIEKYAAFFGYTIPEQLVELSKIQNKAEFSDYLSNEADRIAKDKIVAEKAAKEAFKKQLIKWRTGKLDRLYNSTFSYLRLTGEQIETSQRIFIPLETAKLFYGVILSTIAKGGCNECNMRFMHQYDVTDINKDFIKIGCHKIEIKEVHMFAKKMHWQ